jgi:RecG-like helicase
MGAIKGFIKNLIENQTDLDSAQLRDNAELIGASAASQCVIGQSVKVRGTVQALRVRPQGSVQMVEAELWDGTGYLTLLWLGRQSIKGIAPGRNLIAEGRISRGPKQQPAIYNPRYELLPNVE